MLSILTLTMSCVSCSRAKPVKAHLVIPPECVQEIRADSPISIDQNGNILGKTHLKIKYNCTKVQR
jgi:hypothetical protein